MSTKAENKLAIAQSGLIFGNPFFGSLVLRLNRKANKEIPTFLCDGRTIFFNPEYVESANKERIQGSLAHIVMHLGMLHHTRRNAREIKRWNIACDFAITPILKDSGFNMEGELFNPEFVDMSAEHIYNLLKDIPDEQLPDSPGIGDIADSEKSESAGASSSEQAAEERQWKAAVAEAYINAKKQGNVPGSLDRFFGELSRPQLPWRELLRRFMTERSNDDFSWSRPNRRTLSSGLYIPSRISEGSGEFVIVIDTSGSICDKELNAFGSEVLGIIEDAKPSKTTVIYCDASINKVDVFKPEDTVEFATVGGGGTDFRPPFEYVEKNNLMPKCLVYLTDGYGPFPDEDKIQYPVMWVINNYEVTPPFGEHLTIDI